jgi:RNA polymerase sigma-70 factor (ECF subfamily)
MAAEPTIDEQRLVALARSGDARALAELVERELPSVRRFAMRMCRDSAEADDVTQETLLAAVRGIGGFRAGSSLSTWLYTVARRQCAKRRRARVAEPQASDALDAFEANVPEALVDGRTLADEASEQRELDRALEQAIAALDPKLREVLLLRDVEGLAASEVAEVVGIGVAAVKSRLHRARLTVRERIAPLLASPSDAARPARPPAPGLRRCPDVAAMLSRHLEGQLEGDVCLAMERHVEQCERCRGACDALRTTLALCKARGPLPDVPLPEGPVKPRVPVALRRSIEAAFREQLSRPRPSAITTKNS